MSNARNLANLLGTGSTIATAKLADDAVTSAKIADDAVVAAAIADGAVVSAAFADNAVSTSTLGTVSTEKFKYTNVSPNNQPISTSFTLSATEAPLGSLVALNVRTLSGSSAGDQYCYVYQQGGPDFRTGTYVGNDWYYYDMNVQLYPIRDAGDRTFNITHGTIAYSTTGDYRRVMYLGYMLIDGLGD